MIRFVELLGASNIEVVGIIDRPPAGSELAKRMGRNASIADLLSFDPTTWSPALEPVMSRLSMRLRWWQLGRDSDTSFVGFPNLAERINELRKQLFRFGQDVQLGLGWDWDGASQDPGDVTWDFEQLTPDPPTWKNSRTFVSQPRLDSSCAGS